MEPTMKFAVVLPRIPGHTYSECLAEVAETVHHGLRDLGHESTYRPEETFLDKKARAIVLGVQHFLSIPDDAVLYNLEPPQVIEKFLPVGALMAHELWDYSSGNVALWKKAGHKNVKHVPIGFHPAMSRIQLAEERDIDIVFVGGVYNERRRAALMMIAGEGLNLKHVSGVFGTELDAIMARSKISLNVSSNMEVFEAARVSWACMNKIAVVSESGIPEEERFVGACVFAPYQRLDQACAELVAGDWKGHGERGFEAFSKFPEAEILKEALR